MEHLDSEELKEMSKTFKIFLAFLAIIFTFGFLSLAYVYFKNTFENEKTEYIERNN